MSKFIFLFVVVLTSVACSSSNKKSTTSEPSVHAEETSIAESIKTGNSQENAIAETNANQLWTSYQVSDLPDLEKRIEPKEYELFKCNFDLLLEQLSGDSVSIELPTTEGFKRFDLVNSNTMNASLAAKYPQVKSYKGKSADGKLSLRLDANNDGLYVEITGTEFKNLLSPLLLANKTFYALYLESALTPAPRDKSFD
jgi:hypothetical protein